MLTEGQNHLLVTIGTHGGKSFSGDTDPHFGKIVRIEIETGESEVLTTGHRNPQGFVRDEEGNLWATEHGPRGGDELNLIEAGGHYGWPHVSYGVGPTRGTPSRHNGFMRPVFAWVPSIAISALVVNNARHFPLWEDDLLIASLWGKSNGASIFRVRHHDKTVQYVERIDIGYQVRDMTYVHDGRLALLLDYDRILFLRPSER